MIHPLPRAYYNENDKFAAAWLRELIKRDVIAQGEVDERNIQQVTAADLRGFTQCHFFAGIGVWSYALRQAGWADTECVWTGSCPCQPFSISGTRKTAQDERHLWPVWFPLIRKCQPVVIFGEQVASDDGLAWIDLVSSDLENADYACGAVDTCAAGVGAPQISQRLYFVAERGVAAPESNGGRLSVQSGQARFSFAESGGRGEVGDVAAPTRGRCQQCDAEQRAVSDVDTHSPSGPVGAAQRAGLEGYGGHVGNGNEPGRIHAHAEGSVGQAGAVNGFWADAEWIPCSDGKARPVEPGTFPLAYGAARRVGRLRGYGNALVAPQAIAFIKSYLSLKP